MISSTSAASVSSVTSVNAQLLCSYKAHQLRRNLRPSSIERTRDVLLNLGRFADRPLPEIVQADIDLWLDASPRVARTRYNLISHTHTFYEWAMMERLVVENPARFIIRPRLHRTLPRPISHADLALAVHTADPMMRAWLLLAALEGLRCQEIAGICADHVLEQEEPGILLVAEAKGGQQRFVPLHPDVLAALRIHGMPGGGPIFRNRFGVPFSPCRVSQIGNTFLRSVGVKATMHQLRHRFGTDVYALCKDLRVTQELMGHQSPNSTQIYTEINQAEAVAVVRQLAIRPLVEAA